MNSEDKRFNFETDMIQIINQQLISVGMKPQKDSTLNDILLDFFTLQAKYIRPLRRAVVYAPPLIDDLNTHPKKKEIIHIERLFKNGSDVNSFQSKRLYQSKFHDHLAYEWNIHHLHLSLQKNKKTRFVKQVKQLLFVLIEPTRAVFLGTDNHEEGTFGSAKWLEILHDHFPETLKPHEDVGRKDVLPKVKGKERQIFWDKGYSLLWTKVYDKVYIAPGLGRSTSRHSQKALQNVNSHLRWIWSITKEVTEHYDRICKTLEVEVSTAKFLLVISNDRLNIVEKTTGAYVLSYPYLLDTNKLVD